MKQEADPCERNYRREGVRTRDPVSHDQEFRAADSPRIRTQP